MLADLKDYLPFEVKFVIPEAAKKMFPATLFDGATSSKEIMEKLNEKFNFLATDGEVAEREYDEHEIAEIREEYCVKQENDVPMRKRELEETLEKIKAMKKAAEEAYNSILLEISDLAARVKKGTTEYTLPATETVRIALNGYFLFYAWVDGKFQLAKAEPIPEWNQPDLWSNQDQNRKAMKEVFGLDFPEVKKPIKADSEGGDEQDELPFEDDDEDDDNE